MHRWTKRSSHWFELQQRVGLGYAPSLPVTGCGEAVVDDLAARVPHVAALVVREEVVGEKHVATSCEDWLPRSEVWRVAEQAGMSAL